MSIVYAVLLAAGEGKRLGHDKKQYIKVGGVPVMIHALERLRTHPGIHQIVCVVPREDLRMVETWLEEWDMLGKIVVAPGGKTRQESAELGFKRLEPLNDDDIVVFHNAANPLVTPMEITHVIEAAQKDGAAFVAHIATDTLKETHQGKVVRTLDRSKIWHAQTPQAVKVVHYRAAMELGAEGSDEMSRVEAVGVSPRVIPAGEDNYKITTKRDLEYFRSWIEGHDTRMGIGLDSHRFDREHSGLALGGLYLSDAPKAVANSDGDVMIHALCNAIFQAMGEGSLGTFANEMYFQKGVTDSTQYLDHVLTEMTEAGFVIQHAGFQLEGSKPKIDPIADQLRERLAELIRVEKGRIGITATTGEDLTPFGRGEGIQCFATVTLVKCSSFEPPQKSI